MEELRPCNSPKTKIPHNSPQSWLELESGMPRLMPTYFAANCWKMSPITHTKPPSISQKITLRALSKSCHNGASPSELTERTVIMPSSPNEKKVTNESGFMPVRQALRTGIDIVPQSIPT